MITVQSFSNIDKYASFLSHENLIVYICEYQPWAYEHGYLKWLVGNIMMMEHSTLTNDQYY